LALITINLTDI